MGKGVGVLLLLGVLCATAEAKRHNIPQALLEKATEGQYLYSINAFLPDVSASNRRRYEVLMWTRDGRGDYTSRPMCGRVVSSPGDATLFSCYGTAPKDAAPRFSVVVEMQDGKVLHLAQPGGLSVTRVMKMGNDFLVTEAKYLLACDIEPEPVMKRASKTKGKRSVAIQYGWVGKTCDYRPGEQTAARR